MILFVYVEQQHMLKYDRICSTVPRLCPIALSQGQQSQHFEDIYNMVVT